MGENCSFSILPSKNERLALAPTSVFSLLSYLLAFKCFCGIFVRFLNSSGSQKIEASSA